MLEEALAWHEEWHAFGELPHPGGWRSQPSMWSKAVGCVERGRRDAEWELKKKEAQEGGAE